MSETGWKSQRGRVPHKAPQQRFQVPTVRPFHGRLASAKAAKPRADACLPRVSGTTWGWGRVAWLSSLVTMAMAGEDLGCSIHKRHLFLLQSMCACQYISCFFLSHLPRTPIEVSVRSFLFRRLVPDAAPVSTTNPVGPILAVPRRPTVTDVICRAHRGVCYHTFRRRSTRTPSSVDPSSRTTPSSIS
jgi:hypothetical protein